MSKELQQTPYQDAVVVAGVKAALVREPRVDAAAIQVNISDGRLVIEGYVASMEESQLAADTATQNAKGFTVVNRLDLR